METLEKEKSLQNFGWWQMTPNTPNQRKKPLAPSSPLGENSMIRTASECEYHVAKIDQRHRVRWSRRIQTLALSTLCRRNSRCLKEKEIRVNPQLGWNKSPSVINIRQVIYSIWVDVFLSRLHKQLQHWPATNEQRKESLKERKLKPNFDIDSLIEFEIQIWPNRSRIF